MTKTMTVITTHPTGGDLVDTVNYDEAEFALAYLKGVLSACNGTGWTLKHFNIEQGRMGYIKTPKTPGPFLIFCQIFKM